MKLTIIIFSALILLALLVIGLVFYELYYKKLMENEWNNMSQLNSVESSVMKSSSSNDVGLSVREDSVESDEISEVAQSEIGRPALIVEARISAYTTRPEEGTTCIGYYGENLCYRFDNGEKLIACPSKYGTSTFVIINDIKYRCADRMAPNLWEKNTWDIYMGEGEEALENARQWGRRTLQVEIIE